jgi:hypothetical protein
VNSPGIISGDVCWKLCALASATEGDCAVVSGAGEDACENSDMSPETGCCAFTGVSCSVASGSTIVARMSPGPCCEQAPSETQATRSQARKFIIHVP